VFAQRLANGDTQAQAYREAGFNATGDRVYPLSSKLAKQAKVRARVDVIRGQLDRARASMKIVTAHTISEMLTEVYRAGLDLKQVGAAATAAMGLAKLHGLLVDKTEDVTRRAARSPDAPVEIEVESWLIEQGIDLSGGAPSPVQSPEQGALTHAPAGQGAPLPEPRAAPAGSPEGQGSESPDDGAVPVLSPELGSKLSH